VDVSGGVDDHGSTTMPGLRGSSKSESTSTAVGSATLSFTAVVSLTVIFRAFDGTEPFRLRLQDPRPELELPQHRKRPSLIVVVQTNQLDDRRVVRLGRRRHPLHQILPLPHLDDIAQGRREPLECLARPCFVEPDAELTTELEEPRLGQRPKPIEG
jgi:hypothetical protein